MPNKTFEHYPNHESNAAPARCELCGALRIEGRVDHHRDSTLAEMLVAIAHLYDTDPAGAGLLLKRVLKPNASYADLAKGFSTGRRDKTAQGEPATGKSTPNTRKWVGEKLRSLGNRYPDLAPFLGLAGPRSRAQRARRAREGYEDDEDAN